MNIYLAFTLFSLVILIYWVISELFAMLFRFTGLPDEKARFQVISLLTGCGFTTHESELLLTNKSRRRLARITMLFGYVFNITIVSMVINVFLSINITELSNLFSILIPVVAAAIIIIFMRVPKVRAWGDRIIERLAGRISHRESENSILLLDYLGEDSIAQVTLVEVPEAFREKTLAKINFRAEHDLMVMLIEKPGKKAVPAGAKTVMEAGDKLTVFGDYKKIAAVFEAKERFSEEN
ncbi:MAG: TrkA C-terminal domain-containing protein [Clostridia bacterium]|nr:TrkA C-terminal domain-containing protein [Clostridia bacterium]